MTHEERIVQIRRLWAEAPAQCRFDRSVSAEEARKTIAAFKARDDARDSESVAIHGADAATLTTNIDEETDDQLLHTLIDQHDEEKLTQRYEELASELVELGAAEVAMELADGLDDFTTDAIAEHVILLLVERKDYRLARHLSRRRLNGQRRIEILLIVAESTKDPTDIDSARNAIQREMKHNTDDIGIGFLFRSTGVGHLARLWRTSNDPRDLAHARATCRSIEPERRTAALRAIARHTWWPEDVYAALAAMERVAKKRRREEEFALFVMMVASEYRHRKDEQKTLFAAMIRQISAHLKEERWRRILRREIGDHVPKDGSSPTN